MPSSSQPAITAVHPRGCGDRQNERLPALLLSGSSPRLRGPAAGASLQWALNRFIPAAAGTGMRGSTIYVNYSVHPRGCGDRVHASKLRAFLAGSSPRLRGPERRRLYRHHLSRFIPAAAGTGSSMASPSIAYTVHPRGCGDRAVSVGFVGITCGSSPRLRGPAAEDGEAAISLRFIPAAAGTGGRIQRRGIPATVHPRGCGDRALIVRSCAAHIGSSPRLRGPE